ncbi:hypothetical protein TrLO_g3255 [Triparma laevis f. longispina]|uniref:Anoctamin transmembrane domain-containing protein n=1 Tax=Triparma laevis f. longispina TaxID=1714387 RepID=A0A9W7AA00_9STRA|nr:hypothetical protein TrLO_g3255 [Triparma laevis f. longispina]
MTTPDKSPPNSISETMETTETNQQPTSTPASTDPLPVNPPTTEEPPKLDTSTSTVTPPSLESAQRFAKKQQFRGGKANYWSVSLPQMGTMGVGIQLYFEILLSLSICFLIMGLLNTPNLMFNYFNTGALLELDTNIWSKLSFANLGFNGEILQTKDCIGYELNYPDLNTSSPSFVPGDIDCTASTQSFLNGASISVSTISTVTTACECLSCLTFILALLYIQRKVKKLKEQVDLENADPEDFAVFVRNVPEDVTAEELMKHFSSLYDLSKPTKTVPIGLTALGLGVRRATFYFFLWLIFISPIITYILDSSGMDNATSGGAGAGSAFLIGLIVFGWIVHKGDKVVMRPTPPEEFDTWCKEKRDFEKKEMEKSELLAKKKGKGRDAKIAPGGSDTPPVTSATATDVDFGVDVSKRPDPQPVKNVVNSMNPMYLDSWVAEVTLVHPNGVVIENYKKSQVKMKKYEKLDVKMKKSLDKLKPEQKEKAKAKLEKFSAKAKKAEEHLTKSVDPSCKGKAIGAFIVFNCEDSQKRCVEEFEYSQHGYYRMFQPMHMRLPRADKKFGVPLRVDVATTPSLVYWENLHVSDGERRARVAITSFITFILLVVSFALIYAGKIAGEVAKGMQPDMATCTGVLPVIASGSMDFPAWLNLTHVKESDATCGDGKFWVGYSPPYDYEAGLPQFEVTNDVGGKESLARTEFDANTYGLCDSPCVDPKGVDDVVCGSLSCHWEEVRASKGLAEPPAACKTYKESDVAGCFCLNMLINTVATDGLFAAYDILKKPELEGDVCGEFIDNYMKAQSLGIMSIAAVVIINVVLKATLTGLVNFEHHANGASYSNALTFKMTLSQFLNTAMIALLVNAKLSDDHKKDLGLDSVLGELGLLDGEHSDFTRRWYIAVGSALTLTMVIQLIVPHIGPFVKGFIVRPLKVFMGKKKADTQQELNDLLVLDRFEIETRYSVLLNYLLVCSLYAGGMPILFVLASINFGFSFLMDKLALLRYNKKPLKYDAQLAGIVSGILPFAIILHIFTAAYQYSAPILIEDAEGEVQQVFDGMPDLSIEGAGKYAGGTLLQTTYVSAFVNDMAGDFIVEMRGAHALLDDFLPRVVRSNVLPIAFIGCLFIVFLILDKIFGKALRIFVSDYLSRLIPSLSYQFPDFEIPQPDFTDLYSAELSSEQKRVLRLYKKLPDEDIKTGFYLSEDEKKVYCKWVVGTSDNAERLDGGRKRTWEVMRMKNTHNYELSENPEYAACVEFLVKNDVFVKNEGRNVIDEGRLKKLEEERLGGGEKKVEESEAPAPTVVKLGVESGEKDEVKMEGGGGAEEAKKEETPTEEKKEEEEVKKEEEEEKPKEEEKPGEETPEGDKKEEEVKEDKKPVEAPMEEEDKEDEKPVEPPKEEVKEEEKPVEPPKE